MQRLLLPAILFAMAAPLCSQVNMSLVGQLDYQTLHGSDISDVWGYVDELGNEYALVGVNDGGVSVVDLSDPSQPEEIFFFAGPSSIWRDLKVWNDHAYVTTEGGGGLAIIDLTPLPQNTSLNATFWQGNGWSSAHNLYIDENGICYIFGADRGNGGTIFLDLNLNPTDPLEIGEFDDWYAHDGMARGDTLYVAHISDGFFTVVDVSDKQNPLVLGSQTTGNVFAHNIWVSDDGDHVFTTDEVTGGWMGSYDISDPTDIQELQLFRSQPGSNTIPHNTHFINDYVVTSYYRLGTTVHDVSRPHNVVEVANYDHCPLTGDGFNGGWGTYPWLPSGRIISTDIEEGLFVLDVTYQRACWLEGTVTDAVTTLPVNNAQVEVLGLSATDVTGIDGSYATGHQQAGVYDVLFTAPGYEDQLVSGVTLANGQLTLLDVQLQPLVPFAFSGQVTDSVTLAGIEGVQVSLVGPDFDHLVTTDAQGNFTIPVMYAGTYEVVAAHWGHHEKCFTQAIDDATPPLAIELAPGWSDHFSLDLGWSSYGQAVSGAWERGVPVGTTYFGATSNPDADVPDDCGEQAYVTGNGGGSAGADDVDGGPAILRSPVFDLTGTLDPYVRYRRWFFNSGGNGSPDDELRAYLSNGVDSVLVETVGPGSVGNGSWVASSVRVLDHLSLTADMHFSVWTSDDGSGHLLECGLDRFSVVNLGTVHVPEGYEARDLGVFPNPSSGTFRIDWSGPGPLQATVFDMQGRAVSDRLLLAPGSTELNVDLAPGSYVLVGRSGEPAPVRTIRLIIR